MELAIWYRWQHADRQPDELNNNNNKTYHENYILIIFIYLLIL